MPKKSIEKSSNKVGDSLFFLLRQTISILALLLVAAHAFAASTSISSGEASDELESLNGNQAVSDRAAHLDSRTRAAIVQGRAVDRNWRFELGVNYGPVAFGDPYMSTQNLGANIDLHITPRFSLGVHYAKAYNQLTSEGQQQFSNAQNAANATPEVSYSQQSVMGVINWYMTYGKFNFFDVKVIQFDIYSLAGVGQEEVLTQVGPNSIDQWTTTWTAGVGIGFWLSKHVTSRVEIRYQTYDDENGSRALNLAVATVGFGVLL